MNKGNDYFWVIGGGLLQVPLIAEVRKFNLQVIVSDLSDNCACRDLCDIFVSKDIFDLQGHIEEAKNIISQGKKIVGVLAAGIDAPETMTVLAEYLQLPSVQTSIAHLVHNKHKFRDKLKELGYPVPKYISVSNENFLHLKDLISEIGFPLIVKNTDSSGSRGTKIFYEYNFEEIRDMVSQAMSISKSGVALIEECWEGPEQTVETIFDIEGNFYPCFITDRIFDRSNGYAIELGLRQPSVLPIEVQDEMFALAENVSRDMGIKIGASKFDMILTSKGPRIIEMTVRLSGGFDCQYLVPAATGKNVMRAAIYTALGIKFPSELLVASKTRIGLTESIWPEPGKIIAIEGLEEAKAIPGVEFIFFRYKIGEVIQPYTDCTKRFCFIIVTGKDEVNAREIMDKVKNIIHIKIEKS